ncbi:MAG TPA: peptidoglycan endopeptidase [Novosphingobium sp.]|nr:peptidoglycan endopeptidase [Novosphingobium sp.]
MARAGDKVARAALEVVGVRFRLRGRDPATGLDCVGVVAAALAGNGCRLALPIDYAMRAQDTGRAAPFADALGCVAAHGDAQPGDILLLHVGPGQHHFAVAVDGGFVHAHAGLRRVVLAPAMPAGAVIGHWRPTDPDPTE